MMNTAFRTFCIAAAMLVLTLPTALLAQQTQGRQGGFGQQGAFGQRGGFGQRQPGQMGQGGMDGSSMLERMTERLDLTDSQREQIRAIHESYSDRTSQVMQAIGEVRREISDSVHAEPFDEATIRAVASRLGELEAESAVLRAHIMSEVRQVLTPEQIAKMDEMRERLHDWREGARDRRGSGQRWRGGDRSGQRPSGDDS